MSSHVELKTVWILIKRLLKKPADLDLHCLQELISAWFYTVLESGNCLSTERYQLIYTIGPVNFSLDKYIMAIYLSLNK